MSIYNTVYSRVPTKTTRTIWQGAQALTIVATLSPSELTELSVNHRVVTTASKKVDMGQGRVIHKGVELTVMSNDDTSIGNLIASAKKLEEKTEKSAEKQQKSSDK